MKLPFFNQLEHSRSVLIAGAGGGFDVFAGLPLCLWLQGQGKKVHLANLSFSDLSYAQGKSPLPQLVEVGPDTEGSADYFPERYLSQWFESRNSPRPIYAIQPGGVQSILQAYQWLYDQLGFDTIILLDGGTDILMRGDEFGLGTPEEDISSLAAAERLSGPLQKFVVCLGFGIDAYHGVCHAQFLENVAAVSAMADAYLGSWSLLWEMPEMQLFADAVDFVHHRMPHRHSIVNSSIISAAKGHFGDIHSMERTRGSQLFINPLMTQYWSFALKSVAARNLYMQLDSIQSSQTYHELRLAIHTWRSSLKSVRPWADIPF